MLGEGGGEWGLLEDARAFTTFLYIRFGLYYRQHNKARGEGTGVSKGKDKGRHSHTHARIYTIRHTASKGYGAPSPSYLSVWPANSKTRQRGTAMHTFTRVTYAAACVRV